MLPETKADFRTEDEKIQRVYDAAEEKCLLNLKRFGNDAVLVGGGGYEKIWLETQPMGGEMYALRNPEAALNNCLLFMRYQREDGRLPGSIQYTDETEVKQKQTSDIYSKNGMGEEQEAQVAKEEGTEAEQNQERLDNVSGRMTEEDMAELQKEGFSVGEMTVEQLEAAMERIKLQKEMTQMAMENQVQEQTLLLVSVMLWHPVLTLTQQYSTVAVISQTL